MIRTYIKMAFRNLGKNKVSSFINIGGLAVGMAVTMLISLWIWDELSFNKSHENYKNIARIMRQVTTPQGETVAGAYNPLSLGSEMRTSFPDDFKRVVTSTFTEEHIIASGENKFNSLGNYMESEAPDMLSLKMLRGTRAGLKEINSILLSESLAKAFFGNTDPIDKIVKIDNQADVKVTGVYEDFPSKSDFSKLAFIAPWALYLQSNPWLSQYMDQWDNNFNQVLVQLAPNNTYEKVSAKIKNVLVSRVSKETASLKPELFLHPMSQWHLHEEFKNGKNSGGQIQFVRLFGIIGIFVLLLACINFMNLSTARSEKRAKEVGIRKTIGSVRNQLINQFLIESVLIAALAFILSIALVPLVLPWFNAVAGKEIGILWTNPLFWALGIGFTLLTGLIAGSYPAFYLSSFQPIKVLKSSFHIGRSAFMPRKILVVVQFTVSVALIIGTIIVYRQVQFTKSRAVGFDKSGLIYVQMKTDDVHNNYDAVRNDLLKTGAVTEMAESFGFVIQNKTNIGGFEWKGKPAGFVDNFAVEWISRDYGKTVGWKFVDGRDFSRSFSSDSSGYIINEAAAKYMGLANPVGEQLRKDGKTYTIIGVIKDVVGESPYKPVRPTLATELQWTGSTVSMRLNPNLNINDAVARIQPVFKKYVSSMPFDYKFADEEYAKKFEAEERIGKLSGFFSILAILISCLGLFGLASFMAEKRTREIGIRKVLGASVTNLWGMLSKDFLVLVALSCFIAVPLSYYFLHKWLQNYEYRTEISWWIFIAAGAGAMLITLLTISFQAIKAAVANPVKSLRTE